MSDKMTCPACDSHTSEILNAQREDEPCPYCGANLPTDAERLGVPVPNYLGWAAAEVWADGYRAGLAAGLDRHDARTVANHNDVVP